MVIVRHADGYHRQEGNPSVWTVYTRSARFSYTAMMDDFGDLVPVRYSTYLHFLLGYDCLA